AFHHDGRRQHWSRRAPGNYRLQLAALAHAAREFEQLRERRAHRDFVIAGQLDVTADRENLGAAIVRLAAFEVGLAAIDDDPWHRREGLGVVDRGRLAVEAEA